MTSSQIAASPTAATAASGPPIELLTLSSLYPSAARPSHGIFVETRLRHLLATGRVRSRVLSPVPWFPFTGRWFGSYGEYAAVERRGERHGVAVEYPRYPVIPKIGMEMAPALMARAIRPALREMLRHGAVTAIDAHYFYPDGVAAAKLAREFDLPLVITARGTDINLIPEYPKPRQMIIEAAEQAAAMITVCAALRDSLVDLGADADRVHVLRNGVDLELFHPRDREAARAETGMQGPTLLSVGHLIERKGHHLIIDALPALPDVRLVIVGAGEWDKRLRQQAASLGVADRVTFAGARPQQELVTWYSAADALVLASSREGMANVLLESLACGTPVVATNLWGTPEVIAEPVAGELMADRSAEALAASVKALFERRPDTASVRRYAERFSWDPTTAGQLAIFEALAAGRAAPSAPLSS